MEFPDKNWSCQETEAQLLDYLDGILSPEVRAAFEAHVFTCALCAPLVAGVSGLVRDMHDLELLPEPAGLQSAILRKTLGPKHVESRYWGWLNWFRPLAQPRFAYGALSLLVTAMVLSQALGIEWHRPAAADLRPSGIYNLANRQAHQIYARGMKVVSDLRVVYEIQTRLRPEVEPEQAPQTPQTAPGRSSIPDDEGEKPRQLNRGQQSSLVLSHSTFTPEVILPARVVLPAGITGATGVVMPAKVMPGKVMNSAFSRRRI